MAEKTYSQTLEKIDELIADYVEDGGQHITSINGVTFQYASLADLLRLRQHYAQLAAMESTRKTAHRIQNRLYL